MASWTSLCHAGSAARLEVIRGEVELSKVVEVTNAPDASAATPAATTLYDVDAVEHRLGVYWFGVNVTGLVDDYAG